VKEFKKVRENLLDMLEDIDDRLSKVAEDEPAADHLAVVDSNVPETCLEDSMRSEIANIEQAISQIDSGTYGICLSCGQPIKKGFLNGDPLSSHCIHCAENSNRS
jgi:RNA polymerase-binding transcription factor DksA